MRNTIFAILIMSFPTFLFSQVRLGISTSYATPIVSTSEVILGNEIGQATYGISFVDINRTASLGIGLLAEGKRSFVNAEAHYRLNSYTFKVKNYLGTDIPVQMVEEKASTIHIPVSAGLIFNDFKIGLGPVFNFNVDQTDALSDMGEFEDRKRTLHTGWQWLGSYSITPNLSVFAKYEHSFSRVGDDHYYRGKRINIDSRLKYATVGFSFYL